MTTPPPDAGQPERIVCLSCCYPNGISKLTNLYGRCPICHGTGLVDAPLAPPREVTEADAALRRANRELARALIEGGVNPEYSAQDLTQYYEDLIDAIEARHAAALNAPARVDDWRPIETAPKSEEWIWGIRGKIPYVMAWDEDDGCWFTFNRAYEDIVQKHTKKPWAPTHWMPIPNPPAAAIAAARERE
jgi:hypothetical protein